MGDRSYTLMSVCRTACSPVQKQVRIGTIATRLVAAQESYPLTHVPQPTQGEPDNQEEERAMRHALKDAFLAADDEIVKAAVKRCVRDLDAAVKTCGLGSVKNTTSCTLAATQQAA
jgi:hypothetical protein